MQRALSDTGVLPTMIYVDAGLHATNTVNRKGESCCSGTGFGHRDDSVIRQDLSLTGVPADAPCAAHG
jgi:hypothetical protein